MKAEHNYLLKVAQLAIGVAPMASENDGALVCVIYSLGFRLKSKRWDDLLLPS